MDISTSPIEKHSLCSFLYWHQLFVFSISDWFPVVWHSRCMAAVRCVSCYNKPWLVDSSLAGQTQKMMWNVGNFTGISKSIATVRSCWTAEYVWNGSQTSTATVVAVFATNQGSRSVRNIMYIWLQTIIQKIGHTGVSTWSDAHQPQY